MSLPKGHFLKTDPVVHMAAHTASSPMFIQNIVSLPDYTKHPVNNTTW